MYSGDGKAPAAFPFFEPLWQFKGFEPTRLQLYGASREKLGESVGVTSTTRV